jgi:PAS domain S-box-containing protein
VEQRERSLILLARVQAALGGVVAVVIFALYGLKSNLLANSSSTLPIAIMGALALVYYATFHQVIGRRRLDFSTLILTLITSANFMLIIATTGGLDSPYYSLWLMAIVVAGLFGRTEAIVVLSATIIYYSYELVTEGLHAPFVRDHIVQLGLTVLAAGLAELVHTRARRAVAQSGKIDTLSGRLTEEQLKAQALMASIGEGVVVVDTNRQIKLFNKAAQQLTGWDESSAQNIDYNLVLQLRGIDDKELTTAQDPFARVWESRKPVVCDDLVMLTRSGRKIQLNLSVSPITDNENVFTGAIALFRDISREKAVERQKEEFVSTASHEMRTPVAAIEGYIALAMNPNVATIDDRAMKYLNKAHETIQHLGELFRDLLSVAKAEEGQLNAKIEGVNVGELLRSAVEDMQFVAGKKNLTLILQTSDSVGKAITPLYYVAANPERLREVVMNLTDNAIKYTAQGGIKVSLKGDNKSVTVAITDSGPGIPAEDIPHLFQKFYRVDSSATRTIGGTGLGLYLCRQIIELFNGHVEVESKLGEGSTFSFTLPRISEADARTLQQANTATHTTQAVAAPGEVVQPDTGTSPAPAPATAPLQPIPMPVPSMRAGGPVQRRIIR